MIIENGQELLISVRTYVDKIEGFRNESFEPEEIELVLNKAQLRLLDNLINKNFEQGTLNYEWIRPFLHTSAAITVTWSGLESAPVLFPDGVVVPADPNLYYLVSAKGTSVIDSATGFEGGCGIVPIDPDNIANEASKLVQIAIQETGETLDQTHNSFYGNNAKRPIAEAVGTGIVISRDNSFIINDVIFDYISKPDAIDVSSATKLEWSSSALNIIVDYAVEYLRLTIEDPA